MLCRICEPETPQSLMNKAHIRQEIKHTAGEMVEYRSDGTGFFQKQGSKSLGGWDSLGPLEEIFLKLVLLQVNFRAPTTKQDFSKIRKAHGRSCAGFLQK